MAINNNNNPVSEDRVFSSFFGIFKVEYYWEVRNEEQNIIKIFIYFKVFGLKVFTVTVRGTITSCFFSHGGHGHGIYDDDYISDEVKHYLKNNDSWVIQDNPSLFWGYFFLFLLANLIGFDIIWTLDIE